jgi:dihydroorotase
MRVLISHVRVVQPTSVRAGHLLIDGDQFRGVLDDVSGINADVNIDAQGAYALPGLVEIHGHMREPGLDHKEDYRTGTAAAAAGGYTVFLDMPNTRPPTTTIVRLGEKMELARKRCSIDFAFIFGGANDNLAQLQAVDPSLVVGVKFFTSGHETTPTTVTDLGALYRSLRVLAARKMIALVHAENQALINALTAEAIASGCAGGLAYCETRGELVVATEVWNLVNLVHRTGCPLYVCHVSTRGELEAIRWARKQGLPVTGEAAVYHLVYSIQDCEARGNQFKVSPALRSLDHQDALWKALIDDAGDVAVVTSEHSPHTPKDKEGTIWEAASGMPGIQEALPQMISAFARRYPNWPLDERMRRIALLMSTNPARTFGLHGKGEIAVGNDADLVLVHPERPWTLRQEDIFSKCGWSPALGSTLYGRPTHTFVRGALVYHEGQIVASGLGKQVVLNSSMSPLVAMTTHDSPAGQDDHNASHLRAKSGYHDTMDVTLSFKPAL